MRRLITVWLVVACSTACGPAVTIDPGGDSDGGTGSASTTGASTSAGGVTSAATTSPVTSTTANPTTATVSTTEDPTDPTTAGSTGAVDCPGRFDVSASFTVTPGEQSLNDTCDVLDVEDLGDGRSFQLGCTQGPYWIDVSASDFSEPGIGPGDTVDVEYIVEPVFWFNRWLRIGPPAGAPLIAAISGSAIDPPGLTASEFFDQAPSVAVVDQDCLPSVTACATETRTALEIGVPAFDPQLVLDGHDVSVVGPDGFQATVSTSIRNSEPFQCSDIPGAWHEMVFLRVFTKV